MFIIGGGSIYNKFIDVASKLYLTEIDQTDNEADTFFPTFNKDDFDREVLLESSENDINYKHVLYKRK